MAELTSKKILVLSTGDVNGAYEYAYKISEVLLSDGHNVIMLVKQKTKTDNFIKVFQKKYVQKSVFKRAFNKIFPKRTLNNNDTIWEYAFISKDEQKKNLEPHEVINQIGFVPDIIISGMTDNFMNSTDLLNLQQLTKAEIYTIAVDMNHFTGGCHFSWGCKGYITGCKAPCPALKDSASDLAKKNFELKFLNAKKGKFKIITGSGWTLKQAKESKIYKNQSFIPNINSLIDTDLLNNKNRAFAKHIFGLEENRFYILMGCQNANDPRKGFVYLAEALEILANKKRFNKKKITLLIVSRNNHSDFDKISFDKKYIDYIKDYRLLALLYQAVDVFINSSIEDSGPMMVSEALACGTPVVGFDMGVVNNMVISDFNGYRAELKNSEDLARGIEKIYHLNSNEYDDFSKNAVKQVEDYSSYDSAKPILRELINNIK